MAAPARAMILAAGLGTRLRPLTLELPKPLVPVGDRAMIAHVADRLALAGIREAALNTHHLAEAFTEERLAALAVRVHVLVEVEILGTGGGVSNAAGVLGDGDVVVWNGDILADVDVAALLAAHRAHAEGSVEATLAISPRAAGEGTVGVGEDGRVVRLRGERFGREARGGDSLGIQVLGEAIRRRLPREGCLVGDGYLPLLRAGGRVATFDVAGAWDDVGTIAAYLAANARWLAGRASFVGEGARVAEGVAIEGSVIGAGAIVTGTGGVRGSVIWPGARAEAPLARSVVTTRGAVVTG